VETLRIENRVTCLRSISNEELVLLYNAASLFVFPSLYEGFGLPPLEAMACGLPILASNNSSIPEIVSDAALLFDAQDVEGMSDTIRRALTDDTLRKTLITKGIERATTFSWDKCARETVEVYKAIYEEDKNE
jgi:glycosyltransferase involved in cell wall biosynthesis